MSLCEVGWDQTSFAQANDGDGCGNGEGEVGRGCDGFAEPLYVCLTCL